MSYINGKAKKPWRNTSFVDWDSENDCLTLWSCTCTFTKSYFFLDIAENKLFAILSHDSTQMQSFLEHSDYSEELLEVHSPIPVGMASAASATKIEYRKFATGAAEFFTGTGSASAPSPGPSAAEAPTLGPSAADAPSPDSEPSTQVLSTSVTEPSKEAGKPESEPSAEPGITDHADHSGHSKHSKHSKHSGSHPKSHASSAIPSGGDQAATKVMSDSTGSLPEPQGPSSADAPSTTQASDTLGALGPSSTILGALGPSSADASSPGLAPTQPPK
ncbi:hypothetical protein ACET3Z_030362 [Daucus carota]